MNIIIAVEDVTQNDVTALIHKAHTHTSANAYLRSVALLAEHGFRANEIQKVAQQLNATVNHAVPRTAC